LQIACFATPTFDKTEEYVVVAGAYTESGEILFGIPTDAHLNSACLCAQTGLICEAQKLNVKLTESVCIIRETPDSKIKFLTPCGLCQERLLFFGNSLTVVIPDNDPTKWTIKTLKELQPNHWYKALDNKNEI
jgi:cytidine deaminase